MDRNDRPAESPPERPFRDIPRLYRQRRAQGGILLGLCAGIGRYWGVDPVLIRLICVILLFVLAAGLALPLIYLLFALFIPYEPETPD